MKHLENIDFRDELLPIKIVKDRRATAIKIDNSTCAFHEAIEIKYYTEGESTLLVGTKTVHVKAGDIIVINPYEFHATVDIGNEKTAKYHLFMIGLDIFEGIRCPAVNLRNSLLEKRMHFKTKIEDHEKIQNILEEMVDEYAKRDEPSSFGLLGLCAELFCQLMRNFCDDDSTTHKDDTLKYYAVIEPALRMIRDDYSSDFTVDTLAEACNVSKYHFCRIFKSVMGTGAIQYLNTHRLKIADALLKNTSLSISEIADSCGFESSNYFSRLYKSSYGIPPRKTKKSK